MIKVVEMAGKRLQTKIPSFLHLIKSNETHQLWSDFLCGIDWYKQLLKMLANRCDISHLPSKVKMDKHFWMNQPIRLIKMIALQIRILCRLAAIRGRYIP